MRYLQLFRGAAQGVSWIERRPTVESAPPLDEALTGWAVQKRRASHWNAERADHGERHFLKWFFHGRWSSPAEKEWRNVRDLDALGISTVVPVGWGRHSRGSFIVLEGSPGFPADQWRRYSLSTESLKLLTDQLAAMTAKLHGAGLCHKDLNVYHVLVHEGHLRLIDVGRVSRFRRRRWVVKDLASLLCSARREGLPWSLSRRFFVKYTRWTRRPWNTRRLLRAVSRKAARYERHNSVEARKRHS